MNNNMTHRNVDFRDLEIICRFPQDENELFFMFPKANYPLTIEQLQASIDSRYDSTVIIVDNQVIGFANFYEANMDEHCSIGNVIINPDYRGKGVGKYLIQTMENIAINKYNVKEIHISCFNQNLAGLLLYSKLGYQPYDIEKRLNKYSFPVALINMKKIIKNPPPR